MFLLLTADGEAGPRGVDAQLVLGPALEVAVVGALAVDHRQRRLHLLHLDLKLALGVLSEGFYYRSMLRQLSHFAFCPIGLLIFTLKTGWATLPNTGWSIWSKTTFSRHLDVI